MRIEAAQRRGEGPRFNVGQPSGSPLLFLPFLISSRVNNRLHFYASFNAYPGRVPPHSAGYYTKFALCTGETILYTISTDLTVYNRIYLKQTRINVASYDPSFRRFFFFFSIVGQSLLLKNPDFRMGSSVPDKSIDRRRVVIKQIRFYRRRLMAPFVLVRPTFAESLSGGRRKSFV